MSSLMYKDSLLFTVLPFRTFLLYVLSKILQHLLHVSFLQRFWAHLIGTEFEDILIIPEVANIVYIYKYYVTILLYISDLKSLLAAVSIFPFMFFAFSLMMAT